MELKTKELAYLIVLAVLIASLGVCSSLKGRVFPEKAPLAGETAELAVRLCQKTLCDPHSHLCRRSSGGPTAQQVVGRFLRCRHASRYRQQARKSDSHHRFPPLVTLH